MVRQGIQHRLTEADVFVDAGDVERSRQALQDARREFQRAQYLYAISNSLGAWRRLWEAFPELPVTAFFDERLGCPEQWNVNREGWITIDFQPIDTSNDEDDVRT